MTETPDEALLRKARAMAYGMGITVYIRPDGRIYQHPPGQAVEPRAGAHPAETEGRGLIQGVSE